MINRNNYEIWFLDFVEGQLSQDEKDILYEFLDQTPDLKSEFEEFEEIKLEEEVFKFDKKEELKQDISIEKIDGLSDFEVLTIKKLEDDISEKEERELESMLLFSNIRQRDFKVFENTKLNPNESFTFKNKKSLKRKTGTVIPLWAKYVSSIAAIVILILFVNNAIRTNFFNHEDRSIAQTTESEVKKRKESIENKIDFKHIIKSDQPFIVSGQMDQQNRNNVAENTIDKRKRYKVKLNSLQKNSNSKGDKLPIIQRRNNFELVAINLNKDLQVIRPEENIGIGVPKIDVSNSFQKNNNEIAYQDNRSTNVIEALTPKELIIKTVKKKLDIDDKDYDRISAVKTLTAALDKTNIAKVKYEENEDSETKVLAINIGSFSFSRSWSSN